MLALQGNGLLFSAYLLVVIISQITVKVGTINFVVGKHNISITGIE